MRKLAIAVALSTTVLAGPALARDGAWYVGGDFGAMIVEDMDTTVDPGLGAGTTGTLGIGFDEGFDASLFTGYDFGAFRLEAEVSYKSTDVEELLTLGVNPPGTNTTGDRFTGGGGELTVLSGMVNGMLDFGNDDGLSGFVGGGVGIARVDLNDVRAFTNTGTIVDNSDTRFAWQIIAGVRQAITRNVDLHLKYRFFNVENLEFGAFGGRTMEGSLRTHSLLGGITFNFGGRTVLDCPPPGYLNAAGICEQPCPEGTVRNEATRMCEEPPCPPGYVRNSATQQCEMPPCPPGYNRNPATQVCEPPVIPCNPGFTRNEQGVCIAEQLPPEIVFFNWDRDDLTAEARATLDRVISNYRSGGQTQQLVLAGHADRSGPATYNVGLSQRRTNNVRDYLVAGGIPSGALTGQAFGEERPRVDTPDGVREPQNRRVEITWGPGSGW